MERFNNVVELIPPPKPLQNEMDYRVFVDKMRVDLQIVPKHKRKQMLFELICYLCSLCELFFMDRKMGKLKKKVVMDCLEGFDNPETISRMIEIALETGKVEKKTLYKKFKLYLKKSKGHPRLKTS